MPQTLIHAQRLAGLGLIQGRPAEEGDRRRTPHPIEPSGPSGPLRSFPERSETRFSHPAPRPRFVDTTPSVRVWPAAPCPIRPDAHYWRRRDIMAEIRFMARKGGIPVTPVADDAAELTDSAQFPAGWKGYAFTVPAKGKLHVRLNHPNEGWFRVIMTNKWGNLQQGMLHNLIPTGNPEATFNNPKDEAQIIYVTVDDPGWMSNKQRPFTLKIERDRPVKGDQPKEKPSMRILNT